MGRWRANSPSATPRLAADLLDDYDSRAVARRRRHAAPRPLPRPRAELARLQPAGARARRGPRPPAARARQLPGDLREQPRRVLHGARRRPQAPHRDRPRRADQRRHAPRSTCSPTSAPRAHELQERHALAFRDLVKPALDDGRHPHRELGRPRRGRPRAHRRDLLRARSSRCSCRSPSTPRIRSPTSPGLSLNLSIRVRNPKTDKVEFARLKVPRTCRASCSCPDDDSGRLRFIPLEDLISNHLGELFPGHGDPRAPRVPRHPQRGRRDRGGRDREPHPGAREGAAAPPLRPAHPPRDHRRHGRRDPRPAHAASSTSPSRRSTGCRRRSTSADCSSSPASTGPTLKYPRHVPTTARAPAADRADASARHLRVDRKRRHPAAPPLRVVRDERADLPRAGRRRPERARHQADALPHER